MSICNSEGALWQPTELGVRHQTRRGWAVRMDRELRFRLRWIRAGRELRLDASDVNDTGADCLTEARCLSRSRSAGGDHLDNAGSPRDHAGLVAQDIEFAVGIASEAEDRDTGMLDQVAYPMGDVG